MEFFSMDPEEIFEYLKDKGGPWKTYPNPMRDDGLFVAEDKELLPYESVMGAWGKPLYPATPRKAFTLGYQLPHKMAEDLVQRLNSEDLREG